MHLRSTSTRSYRNSPSVEKKPCRSLSRKVQTIFRRNFSCFALCLHMKRGFFRLELNIFGSSHEVIHGRIKRNEQLCSMARSVGGVILGGALVGTYDLEMCLQRSLLSPCPGLFCSNSVTVVAESDDDFNQSISGRSNHGMKSEGNEGRRKFGTAYAESMRWGQANASDKFSRSKGLTPARCG